MAKGQGGLNSKKSLNKKNMIEKYAMNSTRILFIFFEIIFL